MGLFSKKITKEKIADSLVASFAMGRDSLLKGLTELLGEGTTISNEQDHEIMIVSMFAVLQPILVSFSDSPEGSYISGKFQDNVFNLYTFSKKERKEFQKKLWKRVDEYNAILHADNKDLGVQFGQIFCNHFFGKREDGSHLAIIMFIGTSFLSISVNIKQFLDEVLAKIEIIK